MGQPQIIEKLEIHLGLHSKPNEECQILYLMAEIRKFLEQDKPNRIYSALQFYGNWCVHPVIDRNGDFISQLRPTIDHGIRECLLQQGQFRKGNPLAPFLSLMLLKDALKAFLKNNGLALDITHGDNWESVRTMMFGILSEQPFREPKHGKFQIVYNKDASGGGIIEFEVKPGQPFQTVRFSQKDLAS